MGIDPVTAMIGASVVGGIGQASAASKASKAQKDAANRQIDVQKEMYDETVNRLAPWVSSGMTANQAAGSMLGLNAAPMIGGTAPTINTVTTPGTQATRGGYMFGTRADDRYGHSRYTAATPGSTSYTVNGQNFDTMEAAQAYANANKTGGTAWNFQNSPAYQFNMQQGLDAVQASQASKGGLYSGAAMEALQKTGAGIASNEFWNQYNALAGQSSAGQNAAGLQANAGQNYATGASNALANYGNAAASGAIGVGNAFANGINNGLGIWGYMNGMKAS